ncbi:MAG: c-type cytochrome [Burkholderiaceae bacterium]
MTFSLTDAEETRHRPAAAKRLAACLRCMLCAVATVAAISAQAREPDVPDTMAQRALACAACHGKEGRATSEGYFPRIAGKPAGYLYNQLINFREGRRRYPPMTYMVDHLSNAYLRDLADYFAGLHLPYPPPQAPEAGPDALARARTLVMSGDASRNIPACIACHGQTLTGRLPAIPSLLGLSRDYLNGQFGAWRTGSRHAVAPDCMREISDRLAPEEIAAISNWLASRPIPADMAPAPPSAAPLPMACGSVPR